MHPRRLLILQNLFDFTFFVLVELGLNKNPKAQSALYLKPQTQKEGCLASMLILCDTFYCLSNISLLACFGFLFYKLFRGQILIIYDQNNLFDSLDKTMYGLSIAMALLMCVLTVYPIEELLLAIKAVKLIYAYVVLYVFIRLTELEQTLKIATICTGLVIFLVLVAVVLDLIFRNHQICVSIYQYLVPVSIAFLYLGSLTLGISDLREINHIQSSSPQANTNNQRGLTNYISNQLRRRKIYIISILSAGFASALYLLLVDSQQYALQGCHKVGPPDDKIELPIPFTIGSIFSHIVIFGLEPISAYYLFVWRNMRYLADTAQVGDYFRQSRSDMVQLGDVYRQI